VTVDHPFDEAIALTRLDDGRLRGSTHPAWANMVGPFGGITAAACLHAVASETDCVGTPLALTVNFAAPVADGDYDLSVKPVRINRTNQHWTVELLQGGDVKTTASAIFATRRDSWSDAEAQPPHAPPPEDVPVAEESDFVTWLRNYEMRFVEGALSLDGDVHEQSTSTLWLRPVPVRPLDHAGLAAMCDVFFPRVFLRRGPVPAGTISLTTYFHATPAELADVAEGYLLGSARANRFSGGYSDQSATMWSRDGTLLATSHQIVYFKA
jgi:acyl-CoA thioesterase